MTTLLKTPFILEQLVDRCTKENLRDLPFEQLTGMLNCWQKGDDWDSLAELKSAVLAQWIDESVCENILISLLRAASDSGRQNDKLSEWVHKLEDIVLGFARSTGQSAWSLEGVEAMVDSQRDMSLQQARGILGPAWLGALLSRSTELTWTGGLRVKQCPPQARNAIQELAEVIAGVHETTAPDAGDIWPPVLLVLGGKDEGITETVGGTYTEHGDNHGKRMFRRTAPASDMTLTVLLYYWDDRDGIEQCGWWFGPVLGGDEVWAHAGPSGSEWPPPNGWQMLHSGEAESALRVLCVWRDAILRESTSQQRLSSSASLRSVQGSMAMPVREPVPKTAPVGSSQEIYGSGTITRPPRTTSRTATSHWRCGVEYDISGDLKRQRSGGQPEREAKLIAWLKRLDDGAGTMLQYFDRLAAEFDADLTQVAAVKNESDNGEGLLGIVDPLFWETIQVHKMGHRMLFARGISQL